MNIKLKPCPFCGGEIEEYTPMYFTNPKDIKERACYDHPRSDCVLNPFSSYHYNKKEFMEKWNRRVT